MKIENQIKKDFVTTPKTYWFDMAAPKLLEMLLKCVGTLRMIKL